MAEDSNKTAAAILAAEASRQKRALTAAANPAAAGQGYDIAGELWGYFDYFMRQLETRDNRAKP